MLNKFKKWHSDGGTNTKQKVKKRIKWLMTQDVMFKLFGNAKVAKIPHSCIISLLWGSWRPGSHPFSTLEILPKKCKIVPMLKLRSKEKSEVFHEIAHYLSTCALEITGKDTNRPWGGFFVIDEQLASKFGKLFFPDIELSELRISGKLSPKILVVQPHKRLSWQYHFRRAEIWRVISGKVGVVTSQTDVENENVELSVGESIRLAQGQRHRLVGLDDWGIVAEIWQHTELDHPSDESDIVRLQDDFGR